MTIDTNNIVLAIVSVAAGFFAVAYFRSKINEKFTAMQRHHEDNIAEIYQAHDRIYRDLHNIDRKVDRCANSKCGNKQFVQD